MCIGVYLWFQTNPPKPVNTRLTRGELQNFRKMREKLLHPPRSADMVRAHTGT